MWEIVKCLCLIKDKSVCPIGHWYESPLETPLIGGTSVVTIFSIEHAFHQVFQAELYDEDDMRRIVAKFLSFVDSDRRKLYIPLNRLNTALRSNDPADIALDLGIVIESLVGDGTDDISYKVRQRATFLIGGTSNEKRETFNRFKALYKLRSQVAHGALIKPSVAVGDQQVPTLEFLKECCRLCARMVRKVVLSGFVRDWDGEILGW